MKETVLVCCRYVLFGAAVIPFLVIAYVMFPLLSWSWRIGAFLPFLALLMWGALVLLKKAMLGQGVKALAEQAGGLPEGVPEAEHDRLQELQQCWKGGIDTLRGSHLKQEGNPLYVLPWYLVMGESGSGKSAALKSARLRSPFPERGGGAGGTRNCDWRFYDQGILIDTAGRYAVPVDAERDNEEWRTLLWLLGKHRSKEPINGLILTLPADKLVRGDLQELEDYGRELRYRIDEMTRLLGVVFPVYLLITKCDLVSGMGEFCARLPEQGLDQPMGLVNEEMSPDVPAFSERFWESVDNRLRSLRLLLLHRPWKDPARAGFLLFPDALRALKPSLHAFVSAAFAANHYQETPLLRGIYLSSASRDFIPGHAPAPRAAGDEGGRQGGSQGVFLHDFFEKVLPGDRWLWAPSERSVAWHRTAGKLALAGWLVAGASLCGLLSGSFVKNLAVIRDAAALVDVDQRPNRGVGPDLAALEVMRVRVSELERKNMDWWVPRFGLNRSKQYEEVLKARYCREFSDRFLVSFDRSLAAAVGDFTPGTPDHLFGSCVLHLSRRCNLVKARLQEEQLASLLAMPLPDYPFFPSLLVDGNGPPFANLYLNYLAWSSDRQRLSQELQLLQLLLKQALAMKGRDLGWLLGFVDWQQPGAAIALRQFWHGSRPLPAEPVIAPAFTRKGREKVTAFFDEISASYPEPGLLERDKEAFRSAYRNACFVAWQNFAWQLPTGEQRLAGAKEWREAAAGMAGEDGPYFIFIKRALAELEPFVGNAEVLPSWILQLHRFQALRAAGAEAGVATSAAARKKAIADRMGRLIGNKGSAAPSGGEVASDYLNAIAQIAPVAKSRPLAHRMALEAFNDAAEVGKSPLFRAVDAAQRLNALLQQGEGDETFSRIVSGPITFYGTFIRMETACDLQAQWEEKVLKEVQGKSDPQTLKYLLGKDGPVWKYLGECADPFIGWSPGRGYYAKSALGGSIPFRPEFYSFLARGTRAKIAAAAQPRQSYQVTIKGLPTDANDEALIKPQGTRLELQCASGSQVIANMNYPVVKPFHWSPDTCGDVLFQIDIGDTVLTRRYPGPRGFPAFLREFSGGRQTFYPGQFPQQRKALERMGIRYIRVNYQMFGANEVASEQADLLPGRVPEKIAECWD